MKVSVAQSSENIWIKLFENGVKSWQSGWSCGKFEIGEIKSARKISPTLKTQRLKL